MWFKFKCNLFVNFSFFFNNCSWLLHAGRLENLCLTKSMCSIIQMSENTILSLKNAVISTMCFYIVGITIDGIWSWKVTYLCYAKFSVTYLFVKKAWFNFMRISIVLTSNNVMVDATSVIKSFTQERACSIKWSLWICSAWFNRWLCIFRLHRICCFKCTLLLKILHVVKRHPGYCALMIFGITWFCHHLVKHLLLWSSIGWWLVTYIICFISWKIFCFNTVTIQFSCFS